jgi:hypothetical protein
LTKISSPDKGEDVAGLWIDCHERGLQLRLVETPQHVSNRALRHVLQFRYECGADVPVGRMIAAKLVAELLPQEFLGVAAARIRGSRVWSDTDACGARHPLLRLRDEAFLAHSHQDNAAAFDRAVRIGPRRKRRRGARKAGDQRALGEA